MKLLLIILPHTAMHKINDARIEIVAVPTHKSAVLHYSRYATAKLVAQKKPEFLSYIKHDNLVSIGVLRYVLYNAPSFSYK